GGDDGAALINVQDAELCLADAKCILQHGAEDRLQLAARARYYLQHLRRRRLLLQCLGKVRPRVDELPPACFELLLQLAVVFAAPTSARSHLRSGRTKLAAAYWALCAFERQGHLVGTATRLVGPAGDRACNLTRR